MEDGPIKPDGNVVMTKNNVIYYFFKNKEFNDFNHPMDNATNGKYDKDYELEVQMQIGSKLFPEYPIRSISESFSQLKK